MSRRRNRSREGRSGGYLNRLAGAKLSSFLQDALRDNGPLGEVLVYLGSCDRLEEFLTVLSTEPSPAGCVVRGKPHSWDRLMQLAALHTVTRIEGSRVPNPHDHDVFPTPNDPAGRQIQVEWVRDLVR